MSELSEEDRTLIERVLGSGWAPRAEERATAVASNPLNEPVFTPISVKSYTELKAIAPDVEGVREKVARIVSPLDWNALDDFGPDEYMFYGFNTEHSLAKADAILAIIPQAPRVDAGVVDIEHLLGVILRDTLEIETGTVDGMVVQNVVGIEEAVSHILAALTPEKDNQDG